MVASVHGTDEAVGNQWLIVGAQLDHIGIRISIVHNSADNKVSGCAAVLKEAETIAFNFHKNGIPVIF